MNFIANCPEFEKPKPLAAKKELKFPAPTGPSPFPRFIPQIRKCPPKRMINKKLYVLTKNRRANVKKEVKDEEHNNDSERKKKNVVVNKKISEEKVKRDAELKKELSDFNKQWIDDKAKVLENLEHGFDMNTIRSKIESK